MIACWRGQSMDWPRLRILRRRFVPDVIPQRLDVRAVAQQPRPSVRHSSQRGEW